MNDEQLTDLLQKRAQASSEREQAKQRAIALALAEYEAQAERSFLSRVKKVLRTCQGFLSAVRPMGKADDQSAQSDSEPEDKKMRYTGTPWMFGGVATASVALFAVMLFQFDPNSRNPVNFTESDRALNEANPVAIPVAIQIAPVPADPQPELMIEASEELSAVAEQSAGPDASASTGVAEEVALDSIIVASAEVKRHAVRSQEKARRSAKLFAAPAAPPQQRGKEKSVAPPLVMPLYPDEHFDNDDFQAVSLNPFMRTAESPVSTFSIDVDTASYSFVRRQLNQGVLPDKNAVRIEEMINYFDYHYAKPEAQAAPFSTVVTVKDSPWAKGKKLMHVGIQGYELTGEQPRSNLVFLLDVSGSMNASDKLPLVKQSMNLLLSQLHDDDTVAIVVYAGAAGTVLEPTKVKHKAKILSALQRLSAGGSTAGGEGISLAYQLAEANFDKHAVNRIFLATDGDFNVGLTDREALKSYVERKREKGIYLSVLGFGQGNYHDHLMQTLAQNGNGVAAYIDTLGEAQKVLVHQATSSLFTIAKDVKIQVEFNPATVSEYRLIGYETRALAREDFNNDKVDAGDIGAGHTVTALYEFTPTASGADSVDQLRYGAGTTKAEAKVAGAQNEEYAFLKLRYKLPKETVSTLISTAVPARNTDINKSMAQEVDFAIAVAGFAQLLKDDKYLGRWSFDDALALAQRNRGTDYYGYRSEFVQLIRKAKLAE